MHQTSRISFLTATQRSFYERPNEFRGTTALCGIAGILSLDGKPVRREELRWMCDAIAHRGPDDEGYYCRPDIGLGMRRLSIIDLSTGHQPVCNEDGSVWVVFNGEIYNFRDLRGELEQRGHRFCTATDTETIVHCYEEYGLRCLEKMRGMFTFALWDERRKQLLLARDRLGIKPLYYAEIGGRLLFASELKSLLQLPEVERDLNWHAVGHLLSFLHTPSTESIIQNVRKLEPATILVGSPGRPGRTEQYWNLEFRPERGKKEDYFVEGVRGLLEESVRSHLVSDVPLGAFLSGGIDSSSVVATAARATTTPLKTFSIGFPEEEFNETQFARQVSREFGTDHVELVLEPDVIGVIEDIAWHLDEPFGDSSAIPTYMVSKLASEHVKVVLSGDGGDELFAGYRKYLVEENERKFEFLPSPVRKLLGALSGAMPIGMKGRNFLRHFSLAGAERYLDACTFFRSEDKRQLFRPEVFELLSDQDPWLAHAGHFQTKGTTRLSALQYLDLKSYLPLDILTKVDRMSMAHSIEARVPLLDHKLVEFAATIPPELQLRNGTTKYMLKRAMRGILPDPIIDRPKQGFAVPLGRWFRGKLGAFVRDLLFSQRSRERAIFSMDYIEQLLRMHERGRDLDLQIWTLISFELWCRTFLDHNRRGFTTLRANAATWAS
jgi:asparagine synthase (glutamine-hydrolysing)